MSKIWTDVLSFESTLFIVVGFANAALIIELGPTVLGIPQFRHHFVLYLYYINYCRYDRVGPILGLSDRDLAYKRKIKY